MDRRILLVASALLLALAALLLTRSEPPGPSEDKSPATPQAESVAPTGGRSNPATLSLGEPSEAFRRLASADQDHQASPASSRPSVDLLQYNLSRPWDYKNDPVFQRLGARLIRIYQQAATAGSSGTPVTIRIGAVPREPGQADILLADLRALGLSGGRYAHTVGGSFPVQALPAAAALPHLRVMQLREPATHLGEGRNESIDALQIGPLNDLGFKGSGVRIGIISDSFNAKGQWDANVEAGDLPGPANPDGYTTPVTVLKDDDEEYAIDEGRAMTQLIFDLVPEAELYFHSAFNNDGAYDGTIAVAIEALADAGCDIIVDDVAIVTTPYFQDGFASRIVSALTSADARLIYSSSAGNAGDGAIQIPTDWSNATLPIGVENTTVPITALDWDPGTSEDTHFDFAVDSDGATVRINLRWDEPYKSLSPSSPGAQADLDLYVLSADTGEIVMAATRFNLVTGDPLEVDGSELDSGNYRIVVQHAGGVFPSEVKVFFDGPVSLIDDYGGIRSTIYGHPAAVGAIAVGAADFRETPAFGANPAKIEDFSSLGPVTILFDDDGNRLSSPEIRQVPVLVAPDGNTTTVEGFAPFSGTSAAAPNLAAAFGLLRSAFPSLDRDQLLDAVVATALDMGDPGFDYISGNGFAQPYRAALDLGLSSLTAAYLQNTIPEAKRLSGDAEESIGRPNLTVADGFAFDGTSIEATLINGLRGGDLLLVEDGFYFNVLVTEGASELRVDGRLVGTVTGGTGGVPLSISLQDASLTPTEVNAILRSLHYRNGNAEPAAGARSIELTFHEGAEQTSTTFDPSLIAQSLTSWRLRYFTEAELQNPALEATLWGLDADPDNDGQTNELEYGGNTNPRDGSSLTSPVIGQEAIALFPVMTPVAQFTLPAGRTDVTITAEVSTDLRTWFSSPADVFVSQSPDEDQPTLFTDFTAGPARKDLVSEKGLFYRFRFEVLEP